MKNDNKKVLLAYFVIVILIILILYISYVRFFSFYSYDIEEYNEESSSETAINIALDDIVNNFNTNGLIEEYKNNGVTINAVRKNNSIFISYSSDTLITYEFTYNNLKLSIDITNEEENINKFNAIYEILLISIQNRLLNNVTNDEIKQIINGDFVIDGIIKDVGEDIISYSIDITKKIVIE